MPQFLAEEVQEYLNQLYGIGKNDRIFEITESYLHHEMDRGSQEAGVKRIRIHDLRHTFATHALAGGVDAKTLSGILGHTNASFTLDTYTHVTTDMQKNASNIVGSFMDEIMLEGDDTNR